MAKQECAIVEDEKRLNQALSFGRLQRSWELEVLKQKPKLQVTKYRIPN
jgi:hypothetical protein